MCGRFRATLDMPTLLDHFEAHIDFDYWAPLEHIHPGHVAPVLMEQPDGLHIRLFQWGLTPFWAKDPKIGNRMFNARAETLHEKPAFRAAYAKRRCLVVTNGFYEWQAVPGVKKKKRMLIEWADGSPFVFAGLWEKWQPDAQVEPLYTFTILTTEANRLIRSIHERMPVILHREQWRSWLRPPASDTNGKPIPYRVPFMDALDLRIVDDVSDDIAKDEEDQLTLF